MARPTKSNIDIQNTICDKIASSSSGLNSICKELKISPSSVYKWLSEDEAFSEMYTRARETQADFLADEILEIADDNTRDTKVIQKGGQTMEVEDTEWVNRSKLKIEARKWIAAKLKPKKYGDKLDASIHIVKVGKDLADETYE